MSVARHGVPDSARLELGETHHELATRDTSLVDVLENRPLVGFLARAKFHAVGVCTGRFNRRMRGVRWITHQIENRWIGFVFADKPDFTAAPTDVQTVVAVHRVGHPIDHH